MFPPERIQLICEGDCQYLLSKVEGLRNQWQERQTNFFYTLGLPVYQYMDDLDTYYQGNQYLNQLLFSSFEDFYQLVIKSLSNYFQESIQFYPGVGIPGFHIYEYHEIHDFYGGGPHFDLSYKAVLPENGHVRSEHNYSFTVALALPYSGAGIDIWDRTCFDDEINPMDEAQVQKQYPNNYFPYRLGELFIFSGNMMHQIAPLYNMKSTDKRVTLQGHIVRYNDQLITYW